MHTGGWRCCSGSGSHHAFLCLLTRAADPSSSPVPLPPCSPGTCHPGLFASAFPIQLLPQGPFLLGQPSPQASGIHLFREASRTLSEVAFPFPSSCYQCLFFLIVCISIFLFFGLFISLLSVSPGSLQESWDLVCEFCLSLYPQHSRMQVLQ